jgi:hypothetical protein
VPAILLSESTQALVCELYGQPDLFHGLFQIDRRIVSWGRDSSPVELPHRAAVISEAALLERLDAGLPENAVPEQVRWTVHASHPLPVPSGERRFGSRMASAMPVALQGSLRSACWIEALECGWLFLIPSGAATGWLIAVGGSPQGLLEGSRLIADQIAVSGDAGSPFPASPRIADPLRGNGWLACGSAALAFDPLCGDGTGNAVREAILAAAVIRAAARGGDEERLAAHYGARLVAGFLRHLQLCRGFYVSGSRGPWWEREVAALDEGIAWCAAVLPGAFEYRLRGFDLEEVCNACGRD